MGDRASPRLGVGLRGFRGARLRQPLRDHLGAAHGRGLAVVSRPLRSRAELAFWVAVAALGGYLASILWLTALVGQERAEEPCVRVPYELGDRSSCWIVEAPRE